MKSVLMSIQPKWCELIASGKKRLEVRKTKPKFETPFKVYIYCTKGNQYLQSRNNSMFYLEDKDFIGGHGAGLYVRLNGMVMGEFVCNCMSGLKADNMVQAYYNNTKDTCLTDEEIKRYANGKKLYYWHISDLKIYDKPRELSGFFHYCGDNPKCDGCEAHYYSNTECGKEDYCCSPIEGFKPLKRPPQSWCYVESEDTE